MENILDVDVNGGHYGPAVDRRFDHTLQVGVLVQVAVLPAVGAGELVVVKLFNAPGARTAVPAGKADDIAAHGIVWVYPAVLVLKPDPLDPFFGLVVVLAGFKRRVGILLKLFESRLLIVAQLPALAVAHIRTFAALLDQVLQLRGVVTEGLHQRVDGGLQVMVLVIENLHRVDDQIVHLLALGDVGAVAVHDIPAAVWDHAAVVLLLPLGQHDLVVLLVVVPDNPVKHHH